MEDRQQEAGLTQYTRNKVFQPSDFDRNGRVIGGGIVENRGTLTIPPGINSQFIEIITTGKLTSASDLYVQDGIKAPEIEVTGLLDTVGPVEANEIDIIGRLSVFDNIRAGSLMVLTRCHCYGNIFVRNEINVGEDMIVEDDLSCGSLGIGVVRHTTVGGDIRTLGRFYSTDVECLGQISAREIYFFGSLLDCTGLVSLETADIRSNANIYGNAVVEQRLDVMGDLQVSYLQCPDFYCGGQVTYV